MGSVKYVGNLMSSEKKFTEIVIDRNSIYLEFSGQKGNINDFECRLRAPILAYWIYLLRISRQSINIFSPLVILYRQVCCKKHFVVLRAP